MLCYIDFNNSNSTNFANIANVYSLGNTKYIQSDRGVNENFTSSIVLSGEPLVYENLGYLNKKEGTIEFWLSPMYDTYNDPNYRFYFDTNNNITEEVVSFNVMQLVVKNSIKKILSVNVVGSNIDYFVNGSFSNNTITLGVPLPSQNTKVIVTYITNDSVGDRISIYKDTSGYINFLVTADNKDYVLRCPIFWKRGSWHKVKATYKFNSNISGMDEIRFYVDGYERGNLLLGSNIIFGSGVILGETYAGTAGIVSTIKFKDNLNYLYFGSTTSKTNLCYANIDNIRLSNISRVGYLFGSERIDVGYNGNTSYPLTSDLYTTLISDFDKHVTKVDDFVMLKNKFTGEFDFDLKIFDLYNKTSDTRVKDIMESLITRLKPANAKVFIKYE